MILMVVSGILCFALFLMIVYFLIQEKIDNDIDIEKNNYNRFYGRYMKK